MATADAQPLDRLLDAVRTLEPLIRAYAAEAEQQRRLPQPVVTALAAAGLFRLYTPHTLGGWEVEPVTFYRVVEALARIDASTAWCVWIASGNPVYVGRCLADASAEVVFGRAPQVATAGVVAPYGRAVVHDGGYVVSGRWPYASGCQHSTWLFCCCTVCDGDQMRRTAHGDLEVRVLFVPSSQVTIVDTWEVSGLAGTGSHDVVIEQVFVPEAYSGLFGAGPLPHSTHFQGLLYRYPFILASALPIGALALGIAQGAVETVLELAQSNRLPGPRRCCGSTRRSTVRSWRKPWPSCAQRGRRSTPPCSRPGRRCGRAQRSRSLSVRSALAGAHATRSAAAAVDLRLHRRRGDGDYRRVHSSGPSRHHAVTSTSPRRPPSMSPLGACWSDSHRSNPGILVTPVTPNATRAGESAGLLSFAQCIEVVECVAGRSMMVRCFASRIPAPFVAPL